MRLSLAPWGETIAEVVGVSRAAERAGFEAAWVSELYRNPFVQAAAIATDTERIGIGTAVALAFVRSPLTTALTALDLDELSGGRFTLGLAAGVRRLNEDWHGADYGKPVAHLRETIDIVRRVAAEAHLGGPIDVDGEYESVRLHDYQRPFAPVRTTLPVYIGAMAPLALRLAGEVGDGWISHELCSPAFVHDVVLPELRRGLDRAARPREDLTVVVSACCVVDPDREQARRIARGHVAFYASVKSYQPFFEFHGFGNEVERIRALFTAGDEEGMCAACPDELVDAVTIAGDPDDVREGVVAYEGLADVVKLSSPSHFVAPDDVRRSQDRIVELFGGA